MIKFPTVKFRSIIYFLRSFITLGGAQQFLGAPWVSILLRYVPERSLALRILSFSPHYYYGDSFWLSKKAIESEVKRNDESRRVLMSDILDPYLKSDIVVVDYGCGPGFLAKHVSRKVKKVYAVDIDDGLIACAKIINPGHPQIEYRNISSTIDG